MMQKQIIQNYDESKSNQQLQTILNYSSSGHASLNNAVASHQLIRKFSTCGYLVFSQQSNFSKQSHPKNTLKWVPRFNFPDKHLGNTLQGASNSYLFSIFDVHVVHYRSNFLLSRLPFFSKTATKERHKKKNRCIGYTVRCFDHKDQKYRCVKAAVKSLVSSKKSLKNALISENFLREQQLLQKISATKDCPNTICKYIIHWESDLFYYFATEYCVGGNLFYYMMNVLYGSLFTTKKKSVATKTFLWCNTKNIFLTPFLFLIDFKNDKKIGCKKLDA
ncbi:hypothetical protein RFI_05846 [Reticulomyxa filosa]|uniref:Protein kinase domain-containing protein n=1 Tax=Reticulomyxa filosa TaxID=46433 RepID=X6NZ83_RETFI|nr:hypothetical protein RFI_05846 [Reticulomyxa filosa]|eukprot:ETO31276.1 hypothetical protein RFI_05846 [Reticulomyxa filosa]